MLLRLVFFGLCGIASAQASRTVLDGVYSDAQAARGQALFKEKCARCHEGADVDGPPLTGAPFLDRWREDTLAGLFDFLQTRMPQDAAGSLKPQEYADLLARLLRENQYSAGDRELTPADMASVKLVGPDGPKPMPANALVVAVGCLAAGANDTWTVTNVAALTRTQSGDETTDAELKRSADRPLGTASFPLQNFDDGKALAGQKVQIKGVLRRQGNTERINVLLAKSVGASCKP